MSAVSPERVASSPGTIDPLQRGELMEELYRRYGGVGSGAAGVKQHLRFWRKKYLWIFTVGGARFLKRTIDVVVSVAALVLLSPLLLLVAVLVKLTDVVPGLTCIWQVAGRSNIPFPQQVKLDVQYIESQSAWLDFKLLLRTVPAVLLGKGAC